MSNIPTKIVIRDGSSWSESIARIDPNRIVDLTAFFQGEQEKKRIETLLKVLETLESLGYKDLYVHGGALRDIKLAIPHNDIDVFTSTALFSDANADKHRKQIILPYAGGIEQQVDLNDQFSICSAFYAASVTGDAPINTLAMGTEGRIFGHENFLEDAENRVWNIRTDIDDDYTRISKKRFERLKERLGGQLTLGEKTALTL